MEAIERPSYCEGIEDIRIKCPVEIPDTKVDNTYSKRDATPEKWCPLHNAFISIWCTSKEYHLGSP